MNTMKTAFRKLIADESGQDLIEYALVAAVVGLGSVATLQPLATEIGTVFTTIKTTLTTATTPG